MYFLESFVLGSRDGGWLGVQTNFRSELSFAKRNEKNRSTNH